MQVGRKPVPFRDAITIIVFCLQFLTTEYHHKQEYQKVLWIKAVILGFVFSICKRGAHSITSL